VRSDRTIVPDKLERVNEQEDEQREKREWEREQQKDEKEEDTQGRAWTSEPMGLGMSHLQDEDADILRASSPPSSAHPTVIDRVYRRLTTLSSSLRAQHVTAQSRSQLPNAKSPLSSGSSNPLIHINPTLRPIPDHHP
jgi:hypothetical protein